MKRITAIVEIAENNVTAYLDGIDGIIAVGQNINELKKSMNKSISLFIETCLELGMPIPEELLDEYEINYKFDLRSFLVAYSDVISKSGLERLTGINQKQLWHYASGISKPRKSTLDKVAESVHSFGAELQALEFA